MRGWLRLVTVILAVCMGFGWVAPTARAVVPTAVTGWSTASGIAVVGDAYTVRVRVLSPAGPTVRGVVVQRKAVSASTWRNVTVGRSSSQGYFTAVLKPPAVGAYDFRLVVLPAPGAPGRTTGNRRITAMTEQNARSTPTYKAFVAATVRHHVGLATGCSVVVPISQRPQGSCRWNETATGRPIYVLGDSNADHFDEAIIAAGARLNRPVTVTTANSCLPLDVEMERVTSPQPYYASCPAFFRGTKEWLVQQPAGLVVVSHSDVLFGDTRVALGPLGLARSTDTDVKADLLGTALTATVESLRAAGHQVMLVQSVPHFYHQPHAYKPGLCSVAQVVRGACVASMPAVLADIRQPRVRSIISSVAAATGSRVLDLRPVICPADVCSTMLGDVFLYRNAGHLSVAGAVALTPQFEQAIRATEVG